MQVLKQFYFEIKYNFSETGPKEVLSYKHSHTQNSAAKHTVLCFAQLLSHVLLSAIPWTIAHQAPLSMWIHQARIPEWVVMPSSRESSQPRDRTQVSLIAGGFFHCLSHQGSPACVNISFLSVDGRIPSYNCAAFCSTAK